ncbi:putative 3-hydroxyphenylpropionic transporter MhpT [Sporomusa ovata DSM 2662]|uniref:Putative inner membrane transport protein n=1 Tax=Sporomusa ovata TaxID=2378 RepID=A0A0U1KTR9_9FIRM|nr:MFS transporter [Sporomusa ovata]EQB26722.1 arabinose efflux permease [Sporomusa ovata DSM 2662]CQR70816.1 putative inner membrane transport protein [Sporomusa ovata]
MSKGRGWPLYLTAGVLLLVMVAMNLWLNAASFKKHYADSLAASYAAAAARSQLNIEYAVKYGKQLANFYGMPEVLAGVQQAAPGVDNVRILLPDGTVAWQLQQKEKDLAASTLPAGMQAGSAGYKLVRQDNAYHCLLPLRNKDGQLIGSMDILFPERLVEDQVTVFLQQSLPGAAAATAAGLLALLVFFLTVPTYDAAGQLRRKVFLSLALAALSVPQLVFGFHNLSVQQDVYRQTAINNTNIAAEAVITDLHFILDKTGGYSQVSGLDAWLGKTVRLVPELSNLAIINDGRVVAAAKQEAILASGGSSAEWDYRMPVNAGPGHSEIVVSLASNYIEDKVLGIAFDGLTMTLVSCFFAVEVLLLLLMVQARRADLVGAGHSATNIRVIRPLAFLFYLSYFITIILIPLRMNQIAYPVAGLPLELILGLPISAEFITSALAAFAGGFIIDRKGWKRLMYVGLAGFSAGSLLSWLADGMLLFVAARAVTGVGYGCVWLSLRRAMAAEDTQEQQAMGFSALNAGLYAANLCGCAFGAILADRLGYAAVFMLAGVLSLFAAVGAWLLLDPAAGQKLPAGSNDAGAGMKVAAFFADRQVAVFFLGIIIPSSACMVGFLQYFLPLYFSASGLAISNAGRVFMVYAVCIVYFGPYITRYTGKMKQLDRILVTSTSVGALGMFLFAGGSSLYAAYATVLLLGLSDSVGQAVRNAYFLQLPATRKMGQGTALGLFSMVWKVGQMLGPLFFGLLLPWGPSAALLAAGLVYSAAIIIFWLHQRQNRESLVIGR